MIFVRLHRNLRNAKPVIRKRKTSLQSPVPPSYRLHHRLSSPVLSYQRKLSPPGTPGNEARLRSSSESQVPSSRLALPSRVPPLGGKRALTPELRSIATPEMVIENMTLTPEVIDLGESLHKCSFKAFTERKLFYFSCFSNAYSLLTMRKLTRFRVLS